jgi:hypothetical protein
VSFAAITLCVASQRVFIVILLSIQSGNFWIHPSITCVIEKMSLNKPISNIYVCGKYPHLYKFLSYKACDNMTPNILAVFQFSNLKVR